MTITNNDPKVYFQEAYQEVMYTGIVGIYSRLVHRLMERPHKKKNTPVVLEVGSGSGQHAEFVLSKYEKYYQTDIDSGLLSKHQTTDSRFILMTVDAQNLSFFNDNSVDRLIATCLLAHLDFPEKALREWRRVVKTGGSLSIYIPSEPGMLLRLLRVILVAPKSRSLGQNHVSMVCRDHRNHYPGMREMINHVFEGDSINRNRFPSKFLGWNFSLFEIYQIQKL
jgi:phosphatidylethanolamine/phosphatidyl-N-methylethanolamine N-methyltransferase